MDEDNTIIKKIPEYVMTVFNDEAINKLFDDFNSLDEELYLLNYPVVYIHELKDEKKQLYRVYIGETNNIKSRTAEHYATAIKAKKDDHVWQKDLLEDKYSKTLYVIGNRHFNKSLTLDVENKLIHYISSIEKEANVKNCNSRGNPQNNYFPSNEFEKIFAEIWHKLNQENSELFIDEEIIKNSAIYKASPLHKLTSDQQEIKNFILEQVEELLANDDNKHHLILVEGGAGTGKSVLTSQCFYEIINRFKEQNGKSCNCLLVTNHDQQVTLYQNIFNKLGVFEKNDNKIIKANKFIDLYTKKDSINDITFVD
jgi:hypothetical protein